MTAVGTVAELWRYPVKSMGGEPLRRAWVGPAGVAGDRAWALLDGEDRWASAKTNRGRWRLFDGLLDLPVRTVAEPGESIPVRGASAPLEPGAREVVAIALPEGDEVTAGTPEADERLSALLGEALRLDHGDRGRRWGRHHDSVQLHVVTSATLAALAGADGAPLDARRLRPNVVLALDGDGFPENDWPGRRLRVGDALLEVQERTVRCVMTTREQAELPRETDVLPRIGRRNHASAGVGLRVLEPGAIALGDAAELLD